MPIVTRSTAKTALTTAQYEVVAEVQNVHIGRAKIAKGDILTLTEPQARHWIMEGVLKPVEAAPVAEAAAATTGA